MTLREQGYNDCLKRSKGIAEELSRLVEEFKEDEDLYTLGTIADSLHYGLLEGYNSPIEDLIPAPDGIVPIEYCKGVSDYVDMFVTMNVADTIGMEVGR